MELFGLIEEEEIFQKRVLSFISGAILPLVSLGFIKSLVDYIKPEKELIGVNSDILESTIDGTDNENKSPSNENESPDEEISIEKKEDKFVDPTRIK
jgi:hypothetical protein